MARRGPPAPRGSRLAVAVPAARGLAVGGALLCSTVVAVSMAAEPQAPEPPPPPEPEPPVVAAPPPATAPASPTSRRSRAPARPHGTTRRGAPATARTAHGAPVAVAHPAGPNRRAERAGRRRRPRVDGAPARDRPAHCGRCVVRRLDGPRDDSGGTAPVTARRPNGTAKDTTGRTGPRNRTGPAAAAAATRTRGSKGPPPTDPTTTGPHWDVDPTTTGTLRQPRGGPLQTEGT